MQKEREAFTALLIEDNRSFHLLLRECINDIDGFAIRIISAEDGKSGLHKLREYMPDIVFLDIQLPDISGLGLLPHLLTSHPKACVVMVTGSSQITDVHIAKEAGAMGYVKKPYTRDKIKNALTMLSAYNKFLIAHEQKKKKKDQEDDMTALREEFFREQQATTQK